MIMATEYQLSYTAADIDAKLGKIENSVLFTSQSLTSAQKIQALDNIGAAKASDVDQLDEGLSETVRFIEQELTDEQKAQARDNIGATALPSITTTDAGKFLRVSSDGTWAVETVLNAEEVSF